METLQKATASLALAGRASSQMVLGTSPQTPIFKMVSKGWPLVPAA